MALNGSNGSNQRDAPDEVLAGEKDEVDSRGNAKQK